MTIAKLIARCTAPTPETRSLPREQREYFTEDHEIRYDMEQMSIADVWRQIGNQFEAKYGSRPSIRNVDFDYGSHLAIA